MEHLENIQDLMQHIQQRIDQLKREAAQKQQELAQSLNTQIEQSSAIHEKLQQSQQQLAAQMEYGTTVLVDLERGLERDFSEEMAEFEQAYQNEEADKEALTHYFEQSVQDKIALQLNELKAKTGVALQELGSVSQHIQHLFGGENPAKINRLTKLKQRLSKHFMASRECLAKQLERGAVKLRA